MREDTSKAVYLITEEDLQTVALLQIKRLLTDEEMRCAAKGISSGLNEGIEAVVSTAIKEAIS